MIETRLMMVVALAAGSLAACGGDSENLRTVGPADGSDRPEAGDAILIETRITDASRHRGEVLDGSVIGGSAFCRGGKIKGASKGPKITATFRCAGGRLTISYAPTQGALVQSGAWKIVRGSGKFKGLRGGGSMVGGFAKDDPDTAQEVFTGTIAE